MCVLIFNNEFFGTAVLRRLSNMSGHETGASSFFYFILFIFILFIHFYFGTWAGVNILQGLFIVTELESVFCFCFFQTSCIPCHANVLRMCNL